MVTVIVPYNKDRGWLQDAIKSVPANVQMILSKGDGNWPENFNKAFPEAKGKYIKFLHEDDMLTENSIRDSVRAIESQGVDFIHGNAMEVWQDTGKERIFIPRVLIPTVNDMMRKNPIHSTTLMYRREVFEKVGLLDESLNTAEEYEFNMRLLANGFKIGYCNSVLAIYRRHPQQKVVVVSNEDRTKERESVKARYHD